MRARLPRTASPPSTRTSPFRPATRPSVRFTGWTRTATTSRSSTATATRRIRSVQDAGDDDLVRPHVEPGGPLERIFGAEDDRKGWGRATIRLLTHPLHRVPRVTQANLLLPNGQDPPRLAGDCLVIGALFAGLAYFPLLMVALTTTADLRVWIAVAAGAARLPAAVYVFLRAWWPDTGDVDRF